MRNYIGRLPGTEQSWRFISNFGAWRQWLAVDALTTGLRCNVIPGDSAGEPLCFHVYEIKEDGSHELVFVFNLVWRPDLVLT